MSELPEVYIYMLESMDGIGTGSFLEKAGDTVGDYLIKNIHLAQRQFYVEDRLMKKEFLDLLILPNSKTKKLKEKIMLLLKKMITILLL